MKGISIKGKLYNSNKGYSSEHLPIRSHRLRRFRIHVAVMVIDWTRPRGSATLHIFPEFASSLLRIHRAEPHATHLEYVCVCARGLFGSRPFVE